jgi:F0F1-type ATP synthase membrane subunit b/b'
LVGSLIGLLFGPGGRVLLAVLAFGAWTIYQRADATSDCKEAQVRVELEEANRRLEEAAAISQRAEDRANEAAEALQQAERDKDELLQELQASGESCPLSDRAIERLRAIQ